MVYTSPNYQDKDGVLLCRYHVVPRDGHFQELFLSYDKEWNDITPTSGLCPAVAVPSRYMVLYVCESYDGGIDVYAHIVGQDKAGYYRVYHGSGVRRDAYWHMDGGNLEFQGYLHYGDAELHRRTAKGTIKQRPSSRI